MALAILPCATALVCDLSTAECKGDSLRIVGFVHSKATDCLLVTVRVLMYACFRTIRPTNSYGRNFSFFSMCLFNDASHN
jgi:hypothetical protein